MACQLYYLPILPHSCFEGQGRIHYPIVILFAEVKKNHDWTAMLIAEPLLF
ncbi:MAG: hypothetical protein FWH07_08250 [Oscillospiraceae bacterium]|nr:hypothetical protein [Oscillospiraceae bacterium]